MISDGGSGDPRRRGRVSGGGAGVEGVTLDRDDELGEVAVADDASELLLGDEHAGGGPALAHVAVLPALYVALRVADDLDHRLAWVRRAVWASVPVIRVASASACRPCPRAATRRPPPWPRAQPAAPDAPNAGRADGRGAAAVLRRRWQAAGVGDLADPASFLSRPVRSRSCMSLQCSFLTSDAQTHPEHRVREHPDSAELERAFLRQTRSTARQPRCSGALRSEDSRASMSHGADHPPRAARPDGVDHRRSDGAHVGGARALGALLDLVLDLSALRERLKAAAGDRGVMHEHVLARIVGRDEPVALVVAEPFHDSRGHRPSLRSSRLNALTDVRTSVLMTPASVSPDPAAGGAPGDVPQGGSFTGLPRCSNQATPRVRPKPAFAARHPPPVRSAAGENVQPAPPGPADARLQTRSRWR